MTTKLATLQSWVDQVATHAQPDSIHWCDGSEAEYQQLVQRMRAINPESGYFGVVPGTNPKTNEQAYTHCYLHRSDPNDVARVEPLTYGIAYCNRSTRPYNYEYNAPHSSELRGAHRIKEGLA